MINHSLEGEHYPEGYQFPLFDRAGDKPVRSLPDDSDSEKSIHRVYEEIAAENRAARKQQAREREVDRRRIEKFRQRGRQCDSINPLTRSSVRRELARH